MISLHLPGKLAAIFLIIWTAGTARAGAPASPDTQPAVPLAKLLHEVTHRLEKLQNVVVTYNQTNNYIPSPKFLARWKRAKADGQLPRMTLNVGRKHFTCRFSFLRGRSRYERRILPGGPYLGLSREISTFTPQRAEMLVWQLQNSKGPLGVINSHAPLPDRTVDVAIGLRAWHAASWLTPADIMKLTAAPAGADSLVLSRLHGPQKQSWTFRTWPLLELMRYRATMSHGEAEISVSCSDFHSVQGVALPGNVLTRFLPRGPHGRCSGTVRLTTLHYQVGSRYNTPEGYLITFPVGSVVSDARAKHTWRIKSRPRKLSDAAIFRLLKKEDKGAATRP